ncbi:MULTISPECIES: hypothetical protein [unclassified Mannheimia]|uniref:hypothetical protein n=1 Tax=unclassified Mannheimia TaxID=2645054 RepID=UPI00359ED99F
MATREVDTDFSKEGVERVETYHYNSLNQLVRTDSDVLGNEALIDAYSLYERNHYGQIEKVQNYSGNVLASQVLYKFNVYGQPAVETLYAGSNTNPTQIRHREYDAYGRNMQFYFDKNSNGEKDRGDIIYEYTRDPVTGLELAVKKTSFNAKNEPVSDVRQYTYDEFNRVKFAHWDTNENGIIDGNERNMKSYYVADSTQVSHIENYSGEVLQYTIHFLYNEARQYLATVVDNAKTSVVTVTYDGYGSPKNSVEDYTEQSIQAFYQPFNGRVSTISLSNQNANTEITLDNDVVARLSASKLLINGDATDTLRLKDHSEFKQIENVKQGNNEYEQYQTEVDGQQYTLLIDTDINVVLA